MADDFSKIKPSMEEHFSRTKPPEERVDNLLETSIKILHIDDETDFLALTRSFLEDITKNDEDKKTSVIIDSTPSPDEAIRLMKSNKYDVIISDYEMPEKNGLQLLELVRKDSSTPFIMLTGRGREDVAITALNLGANYYMKKASNSLNLFEELLAVIKSATKQIRIRETLKFSMRMIEHLYRFSPACNFVLKEDNTIFDLNDSMVNILGYSKSEMRGKPLIEFIIEDEREWVTKKIKKSLKNGVISSKKQPIIFSFRKKDGNELRFLIGEKMLKYSNGYLFTSIPLDYRPKC